MRLAISTTETLTDLKTDLVVANNNNNNNRAVFCTICSLSNALGDHMVEAYSSTGLVMALYVASMVSLCLPHLVC